MKHFCSHLLRTVLTVSLPFSAPLAAQAQGFVFYDFACKGIERHKQVLTRTTNTSTGPVTHEFTCLDRSCFHWSVMNPGADNEVQVVEHVMIDEEALGYTFSMMTWKAGDDGPTYRYSREKQLLECVSPVPSE